MKNFYNEISYLSDCLLRYYDEIIENLKMNRPIVYVYSKT